MKTVKIVKYKEGMKVEYPDAYYIGQAQISGLWIDKDSFGLDCYCPEGFGVEGAELIPMQKYYLRGKISYKDQWYVFTAIVDLTSFDSEDYQELLNAVFDLIKKEKQWT